MITLASLHAAEQQWSDIPNSNSFKPSYVDTTTLGSLRLLSKAITNFPFKSTVDIGRGVPEIAFIISNFLDRSYIITVPLLNPVANMFSVRAVVLVKACNG
eukprot:NODE_8_length_66115_cov_0.981823.p58 type:complete len:101 gc:universal NODE_8_length_66115_cov_0.981823:41071-41373(+)